jgi:hypothetical protein
MNLKACIFLFMICFWPLVSFGQELRSFYQNARSWGAGGVRFLNKNEASAFFFNPSVLAKNSGINLELFNLNLGGNENLQNFKKFSDALDQLEDQGVSAFDPIYGERLYSDGNLGLAMSFPYFGFGFYDEAFVDFKVSNPNFPRLNLTYFNDFLFGVGFAAPLFGGGGVGLGLKRVVRAGKAHEFEATFLLNNPSSSAILDEFKTEGVGFAADLGAYYQWDTGIKPGLALTWQNVGYTQFDRTKGTSSIDPIRDNLIASGFVEAGPSFSGVKAGLEVRHLTRQGEHFTKKVHLGLELNLLMLDLRAGFYQGHPTFGASFSAWLFQIDAAMATVELGAYPGQTPEKRYYVGIVSDFGFDLDFKSSFAGSRRGRMKQRR